jgi:hypothetical protein
MLFYSAFSYFHHWERQSNGSTPTRTRTLHGIFALLPFKQSSSPWARQMLCVENFWVLSNNTMNMSLRLGNAFKTTSQSVLIMGCRISYSCKPSITGWPLALVRQWMLLLEVLFCHSLSEMQPLLLRRWLPTKIGMKNELRLAREVVCTSSRR